MAYSTVKILLPQEQIIDFCQHWQIRELSLFGSILRSDFGDDSDVDILVSFATQTNYNIFDILKMQEELEEIFQRKIDLIDKETIEKSPNWLRRQEILGTAKNIFISDNNPDKLTALDINVNDKLNSQKSMSRDLATLLDIARFARNIITISQDITQNDLENDIIKQSAILYQIAILEEAVKRLSPEFRQQHPHVPWKRIAGMRDILTHKYDQINLEIVGDVMNNRIPEFLAMIEPLLPTEEKER
ncbi:HepT-like ribonuclease domain-containing protein [Aphanothece sacrum]|nr:HepT-like ribonuclease domain-containing protein [Aphanothece sacrum]